MKKQISVIKKLGSGVKRFRKSVKWVRPTNGFIIDLHGGIAFSARAHRLIKLNPNLPRDVFRAFLKIQSSKGNFSKSGNVLLGNLLSVEGEVGNGFFKMQLGKRKFFLKAIENKNVRQKFSPVYDLALSQFNALVDAKRLIMESNFKNQFDVVVPEFAFVSGKYSFLVTDFVNLQTMSEILRGKDHALAKEVHDAMPLFNSGAGFLERRGFKDLGDHNTFYSPRTKKFIFFDLRKAFS